MSEIRNPHAARWDFDKYIREQKLKPCFPGRISFADVDNEIERHGHFLVLEGKRPHEKVTGGQKYAMDARVHTGRTCLIVYGSPETGEVQRMQHWPYAPAVANLTDVLDFCRQWYTWADSLSWPAKTLSGFSFSKRKQCS